MPAHADPAGNGSGHCSPARPAALPLFRAGRMSPRACQVSLRLPSGNTGPVSLNRGNPTASSRYFRISPADLGETDGRYVVIEPGSLISSSARSILDASSQPAPPGRRTRVRQWCAPAAAHRRLGRPVTDAVRGVSTSRSPIRHPDRQPTDPHPPPREAPVVKYLHSPASPITVADIPDACPAQGFWLNHGRSSPGHRSDLPARQRHRHRLDLFPRVAT